MMISRIAFSFMYLFVFIVTGYSQNVIFQNIQEIQSKFTNVPLELLKATDKKLAPSFSEKYIDQVEYLEIDSKFLEEINSNQPSTLYLEIPFEGEWLLIQLYQKDVKTSGFKSKTILGKSRDTRSSVHYRGILKNNEKSLVSLSVQNDCVRMMIILENDVIEITETKNKIYAIYRNTESKHNFNFTCSASELIDKNKKVNTSTIKSPIETTGNCVEIYIECDYQSYLDNGSSVGATEDWALSIMNEVAILYENEGIPIAVSSILVYDEVDPYANLNSNFDIIFEMLDVIGTDYLGRLAVFFSTRQDLGANAFTDMLCEEANSLYGPYATCGKLVTNVTPYPTYTWTVKSVAHELGHNFGSVHTHDCAWNGNDTQIDDCGSVNGNDVQDCFDPNNPILPSNGGTIMSYCQNTTNIGINFLEGFGDQPGALILDKYVNASCETGNECVFVPFPVSDFEANQIQDCAPSTVQFSNTSLNNPYSFEWFLPGASPDYSTEENPTVVYNSPGEYDVTLISTNDAGDNETTKIAFIEVLEYPIPDFTFTQQGNSVEFNNLSTGNIDSYLWDFGDGNISNEISPLHTYNDDGDYLATLTVEGSCGTFSVDMIVEFIAPLIASFDVDITLGCNPLTVTYTNTSTDNAFDFEWNFEGGTPSISTEENPVVIYTDAGVYDVSLMVSNPNSEDIITENSLITIIESPFADFSFTVDGLDVTFTNLSNNYDSVLWDFGDGNTSSQTEPNHTYATEGIYDVMLTVSSSDCEEIEIVKQVSINSAPVADIIIDMSDGCEGSTINYSNSGPADNYLWEFEGGTPAMSTESNVAVTYETSGLYNVSLSVSNSSGEDMQILGDTIRIYDTPVAEFTSSTNGLTVTLEAAESSNPNTMYTWDLGDGNIATGLNTMHSYASEGIFLVTLFASNLCGEGETTSEINMYTSPTANFSTDQSEGCADLTVQMMNISSENVTDWFWTFPGGTPEMSTEENPLVTYNSAGSYNVELVVSNPAGSDTIEQTDLILVTDVPIVGFSSLSDNNTVSFTNTTIGADSYSWDFGDSNSSTLENPTHSYEMEGTYEVMLTATNACGTSEIVQTVFLSTIPVAGFSANATDGCVPLLVDFTNNSSSNVTEWEWSFPGGSPSSSDLEEPSVTYDMVGTFDVILVVSSSGGKDTMEVQNYISTDDIPSTGYDFTASGLECTFTNTSTGAISYEWDFGDGNISALENPIHTYVLPGTYLVTLRASNACGTSTSEEEITVDMSDAINEIDFINTIEVYPNPNPGMFVLTIHSQKSEEVQLTIFNVLGEKLNTDELHLKSGHNVKSIALSQAVTGSYFMVLSTSRQSQVLKFVVY